MAPTIINGSAPVATASGSSASGGSWDRSSPLLRDVVADRAAQHRVAGLERVENRALRDVTLDFELYLTVDVRELAQMGR